MAETDVASAKQWLDNFARTAESSETLDYLVGVIDDRIVDSLPEFLDPTLRSELHASTRAHWKGFLAVVTRDSIEVQPAPQISDLARTLARRGFELQLLLSVYRIGQRAVWIVVFNAGSTPVRSTSTASRSTRALRSAGSAHPGSAARWACTAWRSSSTSNRFSGRVIRVG